LASAPSFPGAEASLVAEPGPAWTVELPLGRVRAAGETGLESLRLICDPTLQAPPAQLARAGCEAVFDGVLHDDGEANAFGGIVAAQAAAELILDGYLTLGPDVLATLEGSFVLIVRDGRDGTVLCSRDRLGQYPLFYARAGSELALSTSVDALLRHPRISREVNRAMLADRLTDSWPCPGDETYFSAIKRLPPGHCLRVSSGALRVERWWDPFPEGREIEWVGEGEFERLDELVARAVVRCLRLGQAGILLSGGIDSCTVAVAAADESRARELPLPIALSLLFPVGEQEQRIQLGVAAGLGLRHVTVPVEELVPAGGLVATSLATSGRWPNPLFSPWHAGYQHLGLEARRRGCRAVLSGDGGDEFLGAHDNYAAALLRTLELGRLYHFWRGASGAATMGELLRAGTLLRLWRAAPKPILRHVSQEALRRGAPGVLHALRRRRIDQRRPHWLGPDPLLRRELDERAQARAGAWDGISPYLAAHRQPFDNPTGWQGREELFEVGRRFGLRFATPFWDGDLIDLLARTPPELLLRGGPKGPARRRLAARFPELSFERLAGEYTDDFLQRLIEKDGPPVWRALGGLPALGELGIVDPTSLGAIVEAAFAGRWTIGPFDVWTVLSVETWLQTHMMRE
jgi:asparagine synthetase B (glutamine-hydrolysing)